MKINPIIEPDIRQTENASFIDCLEECISDKKFFEQTISQQMVRRTEWSHCIFEKIDFIECDLSGCSFIDCKFEHCDLSNLDLSNTTIHRVNFHDCKLVGTNISEASLKNIIWDNCLSTYSNYSGSKLTNVLFKNCDLSNGNMYNAIVKNMSFQESRLISFEFMHTPLVGVDLSDCFIEGLSITQADLKGVVVSEIQALQLSRLLGIIIKE